MERRLAAILSLDVVGYSRLMSEDEVGTHRAVKDTFNSLINPKADEYRGRIIKLTGDGGVMEFASAIDAVSFAIEVQNAMEERNSGVPDSRRMDYRIGINIGDIIVEPEDIYGDGVNIAARLEGLAEPGGICITQSVVDQIKGKLQVSFEDIGQQTLKNITDPVRVFNMSTGKESLAPALTGSQDQRALAEKPSIAVLPFSNLSGDPEQEYFASGIAEDIITALSRFRWFFVIARNSSFAYGGRSTDVAKIANELGVRYILEGSVRKSGDRVRISAQLSDANSGRNIWAERYDRELQDIFAAQDEISEAIVTTVAPAFISEEARRVERKTPGSLDAWDLAVRGSWCLSRRGRDDIAQAKRLFQQALDIDPNSTMALSGLAFALCWINLFAWEAERETVRAKAYEAARRAVDLDDDDAWAHTILGWVNFGTCDLDSAIAECRRALTLNPSQALAESVLSIAYSWRGDYADALEHAKAAERLSPRDPAQSMWSFARTAAEFGAGNYEDAVVWARKTSEVMPEFPGNLRYLASSLGHLDKVEEARDVVSQSLKVTPHDSLHLVRELLPSDNPERMERFIDGLRIAGLPD